MTDWNKRFLKMACNEICTWSKDGSTKVSTIIIDKNNHIRTIAYNGFPKGIEDNYRLDDRIIKNNIVVHAEMNAISICAKLGIATDSCTMVVSHHPCNRCAGPMINAGIVKVIATKPSDDLLSRWGDNINLARDMFKEAGVELILIDKESLLDND